ncbi:hypothetical protein M413DRAFT_438543 [Hebeloma cylindrosporum]|uniref:Inositol-pentakisphosphate 2-kinase n=1 Tax=Hebeloma cylindrosporum TaxID=76867 RepID=A0A0C2YHU0_HEBCY|nr:hypothetical protein M413DRAFT_438543 [Hebeloma cylindrosporum h7]
MTDILQTKPADWKYVSEGGATIVFSYDGPSHPDFDGKVLRLRKSTLQKKTAPVAPTQHADGEPDDPTIEYQTKCIQKLIPSAHLPRLQTVQLDRFWLEELVKLQDGFRPQERKQKDEIDLERKKGVLATDLVGGNWLAVEIKPKWAFMPSLVHLSDETKAIKSQTCRFCMHSHLRARRGQQEATEYCPLDLFSGNERRIALAVNSLWDAWVASNATMNNLKVFAGGRFVTPSEAHLLFAEGYENGQGLNAVRDAFAVALVQPLLHTPVLRILSDLQRDLDALDIEGLSKLWKLTESSAPLYRQTFSSYFEQFSGDSELEPPTTPIGVSSPFLQSPEPCIFDWIDFVDAYLTPKKPEMDHSKPSPENLRYYLLAYLLSATVKDCSVIVKLDFLKPEEPQQDVKPDSVTVIDLDPKSMDKLRHWEQLDREIAQTYSSVQIKKVCVDEGKKS